ncbi:MAG: tetratricopeptide repeat protein [candidate division Zixibacteria bacterium]|nr:tetratricopeptide repeat protein [Candidatus Tariuqbacter arcticus]
MYKYFLILLLLAGIVLQTGCKKLNDSETFAQANQFQREGQYCEAIDTYRKLTEQFPDSKFCPQAQFMIGFIFANDLEDLEKAKTAYEKFLETYPDHEMAKDAGWELKHLGEDINDIEKLTKISEETTSDSTAEEPSEK